MSASERLAPVRAMLAGELHALDSWAARTARIRAQVEADGVRVRDTGRLYSLRLCGRTSTSTISAYAACASWAQTVMREFPAR